MSMLLENALAAVHALPSDEQDRIALAMLRLAGRDEEPTLQLLSDERVAIAVSKAAAARGEFASDAELQKVWAKHGL